MNITPAIDLVEQKNNMTRDEFQQKLCTWLQQKGLICELRNYFRTNMISVLSNTSLGSYIATDNRQITPKTHAVNLLISEHLARADYHFSLCVFCTEASGVSPNEKFRIGYGDKFSYREVYDILETLNVLAEDANRIYGTYNTTDNSLLMCMLNPKLTYVNGDEPRTDIRGDDPDSYANVGKFLAELPYERQAQVKRHIKRMHDAQNEKLSLAVKTARRKGKDETAKCRRKIKDLQRSFDLEKTRLEKELFRFREMAGVRRREENKLGETRLLPVRSASLGEDVENARLKLLIERLQLENRNLSEQNEDYLKRIRDMGRRADALLREFKASSKKTKNSRSRSVSDVPEEISNLDKIVQEARCKLKALEIETDGTNVVKNHNVLTTKIKK